MTFLESLLFLWAVQAQMVHQVQIQRILMDLQQVQLTIMNKYTKMNKNLMRLSKHGLLLLSKFDEICNESIKRIQKLQTIWLL